jgi:CRISPR-associated endoribonuclease Cas6
MRIKFQFTGNYMPVPIQNYTLMNAYINKVLGPNNELHDKSGLYNISSIQGGKLSENKHTLDFPDGAYFFVSSLDENFVLNFFEGVSKNRDFGFGIKFKEIIPIHENFVNGWNLFNTISPALFRESVKMQPDKFGLISDPDFTDYMRNRIIKKFKHIVPDYDFDNNFELKINQDRVGHKVKSILVKNRINKASQFGFSVRCTKQFAELLYSVGIGQSTNSGFGTICTATYFKEMRMLSKKIEDFVHV